MYVDIKEVKKFSDIAFDWWNPDGKFKPLHEMNLARLEYIKSMILNHFGKLDNCAILDVGCGGGLVSIPLASLGAKVLGIDAGAANIEAAIAESKKQKVKVDFQNELVENITEKFDIVISLEVIEHVQNPEMFIGSLLEPLKKDGILILSTINRNFKSYILGIIAAEYILKLVDIGTHQYQKFIKPSEIYSQLKKQNFAIYDMKGIEYQFLNGDFKLTDNVDVNYILCAKYSDIPIQQLSPDEDSSEIGLRE